MERHIDIQLEKLKTKLIKMCSLVDEQMDCTIQAIEKDNSELADLVIVRDDKVDKFDVKIEKICQKLIALNQPVAMDLRRIISALTITGNLERIGDLLVNVCEGLKILKKKPGFYPSLKVTDMLVLGKEMLKLSIDSFIDNDPKIAERVIRLDDQLDALNRENHQLIVDVMKSSPEHIEQGVTLIVMCRDLERLGDHATNIAEDVYFIVEAQLIKHNYEKYLFTNEDDGEDGA